MNDTMIGTYARATVTTAQIEAGSEFLTVPRGDSSFVFVLNGNICNDLWTGNIYQNGNAWIKIEKEISKSEYEKVGLKKRLGKTVFEKGNLKFKNENENLKTEIENESYTMKYPITPMRDVSAYYHNAQLDWDMFDCPHRLKEWCNKYFPYMANRDTKIDIDYIETITEFDTTTLLLLLREIHYLNIIFISPNTLAHIFGVVRNNIGRKLKQLEKDGVLVYDKIERSRYRIVVNPLVASKQDGLMADYVEYCKRKCFTVPSVPSADVVIKNKYDMDNVDMLLNPPESAPISDVEHDTSMLDDNYIEELDIFTKSNSKDIVERICKSGSIDYKLWMDGKLTLKTLGDNYTAHTYK